MDKLITVKGIGKLSLKPDIVIFSMKLESKHIDYVKTLENIAELLKEIKDTLEGLGSIEERLKTSKFSINTDYENTPDEKGVYKTKFVGYICEQWLTLETELDMVLIGEILESIGKTKANPNISINFSVKDKEKLKEKVLIRAMEDAKFKAKVLTENSLINLGKIVNIEYSSLDDIFLSDTECELLSANRLFTKAINLDWNPEDIIINDSVTITWEII